MATEEGEYIEGPDITEKIISDERHEELRDEGFRQARERMKKEREDPTIIRGSIPRDLFPHIIR